MAAIGQLGVLARMEAGRHLGDLVAVAHPHVEAEHAVVVHVVLDAVQQARLADHVDAGVAELAQVGALHLAAHLLGHGLHAVADAEQRHLQVEHACGARGLSACTDSGPPARMMRAARRR